MQEVCVGRQPIYDRARNIVAWELLFRRPGGGHTASVTEDGDAATAQTIVNALVEIGLDRIAGAEPVFLNCTRTFLERDPILPPRSCVLEVLENIEVDASLLAGIDRLKALGYRIALDDFAFRAGLEPLVDRADIIKLDVLALDEAELARHVRLLARDGVTLLAEKIDSEEQLHLCEHLGFELFQGYFLRRPDTLSARSLRPGKLAALCLLNDCSDPDADMRRIEQLVASDPALSYKVLQVANSALFGRRFPIESLPQAVSLMGTAAMLRWLTVLILAGLDDFPPAYLENALQRARMGEMLAGLYGVGADQAYLMGLLSVMDSALQVPMSRIVEPLPLSAPLKDALLNGEGGLGRLLTAIRNYESGDWGSRDVSEHSSALQGAFWEAAAAAKNAARQASGLDPRDR